MSSTAIIIPARWGSTRFPGKLLHPIAGKPVLEHVWRRCLKSKLIKTVIIATDDKRIMTTAKKFGAEVMMSSKRHQSGTDRIAEVARLLEKKRDEKNLGFTHFINVQGDEPLIDPKLIDRLARTMMKDTKVEMITAATPMKEGNHDPNVVKVVLNRFGNALYFSRSMIPYHRDAHDSGSALAPLLHLGIYGFRADTLQQFVRFSPSPLERCEKLEQLRALEHGISIRVLTTSHKALGIDTPEDAERMEALWHALPS
ncbi:MAG: 3-deoxy-manno-octulosonate cytidylyltransferase [Chthoniobacterales bacterium]